MADSFSIDTSQFDKAIADLSRLPRAVWHHADQAGETFSRTVRDAWRDKLAGNPYAPRVPFSITYDRTSGGTEAFEYEIGAEKGTGKQGGVALLLEYGAPARGLGPRGYGLAALSENLDDLEQGIERAVIDGAKEVGW